MTNSEETEDLLNKVEKALNEHKLNPDAQRKERYIMLYGDFKETFAYELAGRSEYEQAIAFSFYVAMTSKKKTIEKLRKEYNKSSLKKKGKEIIHTPVIITKDDD